KLASIGLHNKKNKKHVLEDLLILLSPELASHPFDKAKKNIEQSYIDSVLNQVDKIEHKSYVEYDVYGDTKGIKNGLLKSFNSLTDKYSLDYENKKDSLLELMERTWANLGNQDLKHAFKAAYLLAKKRLSDESSYLPSAGTPASKIIALGILFE
ncbi:MAG: hypothetical protein ACPH5T_05760, partial [Candidatus Poseidoniaceae archaeon]